MDERLDGEKQSKGVVVKPSGEHSLLNLPAGVPSRIICYCSDMISGTLHNLKEQIQYVSCINDPIKSTTTARYIRNRRTSYLT
jgi:hypothetical protein